MNNITNEPENWGSDHWSTFAYIETRIVDYDGSVSAVRMRQDGAKYPTRLKHGGLIYRHNDYNCAGDLVLAGLIEFETGAFKLMPLGEEVCRQLRKHKANGGNWRDFTPKEDELSKMTENFSQRATTDSDPMLTKGHF